MFKRLFYFLVSKKNLFLYWKFELGISFLCYIFVIRYNLIAKFSMFAHPFTTFLHNQNLIKLNFQGNSNLFFFFQTTIILRTSLNLIKTWIYLLALMDFERKKSYYFIFFDQKPSLGLYEKLKKILPDRLSHYDVHWIQTVKPKKNKPNVDSKQQGFTCAQIDLTCAQLRAPGPVISVLPRNSALYRAIRDQLRAIPQSCAQFRATEFRS